MGHRPKLTTDDHAALPRDAPACDHAHVGPLVYVLQLYRSHPRVSRLALDTRRSRRRLQQLSQAPPTSTPRRGDQSPSIPSAAGLSIQSLRDAIRRVERELESDLIESMDSPTDEVHHGHVHHKGHSRPHAAVYTKVDLKDSQLRMALWLNKLPIKKYITWYPDVANAHSVSIVRSVDSAE